MRSGGARGNVARGSTTGRWISWSTPPWSEQVVWGAAARPSPPAACHGYRPVVLQSPVPEKARGEWLPTRRKLRGSGDRRGRVLGACCLSPHGGAATLVAGTWAVVCGRLLDEALIFVVRGKDKVDRHRAHTETRRTQVFPFDLLLLV
jgi:hypothetical protein